MLATETAGHGSSRLTLMTSCLVIQHVVPESAFAIGDALVAAGVGLDTRRTFAGGEIPVDVSSFDGVVVLGGPMSAVSDVGFASRRAEIDLLAAAIRLQIPTLGVCLGAQLLAAAAGAAVTAGGSGPEIGWAPVQLVAASRSDLLFAGLPEELTVLHWHGDTFELPAGAERLATNATYRNQAFRVGSHAWGLQFHIEVTAEAVERFLAAFDSEAQQAAGGSSAIRRASNSALNSLRGARELVLERFAALVVERVPGRHLVDLD
jgi:GMP synthase-like glutamine amidotransferase